MIKSNLPVILLKELVLLPHQEVRIEFSNEISKKIIDISSLYHDDEVLVVCPMNTLEEAPDTSDLPKMGVIGKVKSNIELPNGNIRVVLEGLRRVKILSYVNYSNEDDVLESIVCNIENNINDEIKETALLRKLMSSLEKYIVSNHLISNSIMSSIKGITDLDKLTDMVASFLPLNFEKKLNLMLNASSISRAKYLIKEISIELSVLELENKIDKDLKKELDETQKRFILNEKVKIIKKELGESDFKNADIDAFKEKIKNLSLPDKIEKRINNELKRYELTPEASPEVAVIRNYIDTLLNIPWNKESNTEKNINKIEKKLNSSHYGLNDIKERIIEYITVKENNSSSKTPVICLVGPPGVGKTTFATSIAEALNKSFAKISLGGLSDAHELIGHRRTYIGSSPGKIVTSLVKAGTKNPVILLDEIDKITKSYQTDPASALLDILDINANNKFIDNYIEEEIDLSEVLFIVTANNVSLIPPALLDRLEIIEMNGYTEEEKIHISEDYLIKNALINVGLNSTNIKFDISTIKSIIENYTRESGVRELDRYINKIIRKILLSTKKEKQKLYNFIVTKDSLVTYLKEEIYPSKYVKKETQPGFMTGVAYTILGGSTLDIEIVSYPGNGKIKTTGLLGKVMKESISVSISYLKAHAKEFKIEDNYFDNKDFHIHFTEGAVPKDGPSAGVLITTSLLSYIKNKPIKNNISMTGEMTLLGTILPIGGLKEKSLSAFRYGIDTIYLSNKNKKDLNELDESIKNNINYILVDNYIEIYRSLFKK